MKTKVKFKGKEAKRFDISKLRYLLVWSFFAVGLAWSRPSQALTIVESSKVNILPGESKNIFVSIKNQTDYTWYGGAAKTSLYLYGTSSKFKHSSWLKDDKPATIAQSSVKPGALATASFWVKAPTTPGTYVERFLLGDGITWHRLTVIELNFVVSGQALSASSVPSVQPSVPTTGGRFANQTAYQASVVSKGGTEWQVNQNDTFTVTIQFKNAGKQVWRPTGDEIVSLYALSNNFKDSTWKADFSAGFLSSSVSPGGTGKVIMNLKAPSSPGSYNENFELRVNGLETIVGSQFSLPIKVVGNGTPVQTTTPAQTTSQTISNTVTSAGQYLAKLLLKPSVNTSVTGNSTLSLTYGIKNIGNTSWNRIVLKLKDIAPNLGTRLSSVQHESWISSTEVKAINTVVAPGNLSLIDLKLKAPAKSGSYTVRLAMVADGQEVPGGEIDIPVTVTADGYIAPEPTNPAPVYTPPSSGNPNLPSEPIIRVGLYATTDDTLKVRGVVTGMNITQGGSTVCSVGAGQEVVIRYNRSNAVYTATGSGCQSQSTQYFVATAADGLSPLEITDYSRPVSWLPGANDNKFRAKLELRYTPKTSSVWVINELPIEWYLKGIAETSNISPMEFQKTLLVAARTYAMYHVTRATKHADEFYIVDAKYDQVYRGYGQEARSPNIVSAVDATRGLVVTYNGNIAITPYFSRSDGRTRSWSEVWYGTVEWCIGVPVPQDAGKTLWGHGVGMSASGALAMANEGQTYNQILKYFYRGIELTPKYR